MIITQGNILISYYRVSYNLLEKDYTLLLSNKSSKKSASSGYVKSSVLISFEDFQAIL